MSSRMHIDLEQVCQAFEDAGKRGLTMAELIPFGIRTYNQFNYLQRRLYRCNKSIQRAYRDGNSIMLLKTNAPGLFPQGDTKALLSVDTQRTARPRGSNKKFPFLLR